MVANMLEGVEVRCGVEYKEPVAAEPDIAAKTIYCGPIDAFAHGGVGKAGHRKQKQIEQGGSRHLTVNRPQSLYG